MSPNWGRFEEIQAGANEYALLKSVTEGSSSTFAYWNKDLPGLLLQKTITFDGNFQIV